MASGTPDWSPKIISSGSDDEQLKIDVTDSDSSESFSQEVRSMLVTNDGPNAVHYKRNAAADTNNFKLPARSWFIADVPITTPHFICESGQTATIYCLGVF